MRILSTKTGVRGNSSISPENQKKRGEAGKGEAKNKKGQIGAMEK